MLTAKHSSTIHRLMVDFPSKKAANKVMVSCVFCLASVWLMLAIHYVVSFHTASDVIFALSKAVLHVLL